MPKKRYRQKYYSDKQKPMMQNSHDKAAIFPVPTLCKSRNHEVSPTSDL
jgi:hypothetical protein